MFHVKQFLRVVLTPILWAEAICHFARHPEDLFDYPKEAPNANAVDSGKSHT